MKITEIKIALRVDASSQIGTGHFMRCLTLADGLKQQGARVRFVCRHLPDHLRNKLSERGYEFTLLPPATADAQPDGLAHSAWLGVGQQQDAAASISALSDAHWDWLIVDHYALDASWESRLRQTASHILVIDDIADRVHDCDILLDQNLYADMETRYNGRTPAHCQLLLGPRFALLRNEFNRLRAQVKPRSGPVSHILVFFGGIDADNFTERAIDALAHIKVPGIHVDVVIGAQHPSREQISTKCLRLGFACHVQTDRMAALMAAADLSIGAGGAATWERCCLGVPTLAFCTAKNQQDQLKDAALRGLLCLPDIDGDLTQLIARHVLALIENSYLRQYVSANGMQAVDGRGAMRVIGRMLSSSISMRQATLADSEQLFQWRNHPSIRTVSRNTDVIEWRNHQPWLVSVLSDPKKILLIGEVAGEAIGVIRFDIQNEVAEVSIYLVPERSASGLGRALLQSAEHWLAMKRPEIKKIRAYVLGKNERSLRFFSGAGYALESADYCKRLH